jgi:hypothetical protein
MLSEPSREPKTEAIPATIGVQIWYSDSRLCALWRHCFAIDFATVSFGQVGFEDFNVLNELDLLKIHTHLNLTKLLVLP